MNMRIGVTFFHEKRRTHHVTAITLTGRGTADLELQTGQNKTEYVQFNVSVNKDCQNLLSAVLRRDQLAM